MLRRHIATHKRYYLGGLFCMVLALLSSCGGPTVLLEQTRLNLELQPTPAPVGLSLSGQPCNSTLCTPTAVPGSNGGTTQGGTTTGTGTGLGGVTTASIYGTHLANSLSNIHLFMTFSYNVSNPSVAKYYDFVWGADTYQVSGFRSANPNITLSYYIPFSRDGGVYGNSQQTQSLSYWRNTHPDWVVYKCDRTSPAYFDDNVNPVLDFTNPAFINWQVQTFALPASQNGFDALGTDNVNMDNGGGACGVYRNGQWVQLYSGNDNDPQWRQGVLSWMQQISAKLHALPHPMALIPNLDLSPVSPSDPFAQQIANSVDGILDEGGFTQYGQGNLTDSRWVQTIQFMQSVQAQGKPYYVLNEVPDTGSATMEWVIGSFLMANEQHSALFISLHQQYGADLRYPEYNINVGTPINDMYSSQGTYWRNFTNGLVVVNPSSSNSYSINLPNGNYVNAEGNHVGQSVTMAPNSALVLSNG